MSATLVVARGRSIWLVSGPSTVREYPTAKSGPSDRARSPGELDLPASVVAELERLGPTASVLVCGSRLHAALLRRLARPVHRADPESVRAALAALPPAEPTLEREQFLDRARADLESAMRSPEELLVSLAREEERVERSVGREARAAEAFVAVPGTVLEEYARSWVRARELISEHYRELVRRLELEARTAVPNLSAVVGPRTAARLVAAAGGIAPLARMSSSRLQLLGSRRRPSAERGPRYGALYLADGADEVPPERRGAYARSLASLAVIAVRADWLTHRDIAAGLVRRRESRRSRLQRRAR